MCSLTVAIAHAPVHCAAAAFDDRFEHLVLSVGLGGRRVLNANYIVNVAVPVARGDEFDNLQKPGIEKYCKRSHPPERSNAHL
jgi:hypothetical protein